MLLAHPHPPPPYTHAKNDFKLNTNSFLDPLLFFSTETHYFTMSYQKVAKKKVKPFIHPKIGTSRANKHLQKKTYDMFSRVR